VNNVGAFAELPDAACVKVALDTPDEVETLYLELLQLYQRPDRLRAMGAAARVYMAERHDPGRVAARYMQVVESIVNDT
jgi:hypothetical protein